MLILVFSVKLHILPTSGSFGPEYVVLPSVALAPWVSVCPGLALTITVLAVYFFGDG